MAQLRFFFDHGAGGCLWAGDGPALDSFGSGPLDAPVRHADGAVASPPRIALTPEATDLRDRLERDHRTYLNPLYPPDPSLWSAARCARFNAAVDALVAMLRRDLSPRFVLLDEQERYREDPRLAAYLAANPHLEPMP